MHQLLFSFAVLLLVAALTAACAQSVTSPTSAQVAGPTYTAGQLAGTWTLAWIERAGEARQNRPFDATYTLSFSDGRLSTRVDCNSCGGSYSVNESTLTAGPNLACTRAACPTMAFENAYTAILSGY